MPLHCWGMLTVAANVSDSEPQRQQTTCNTQSTNKAVMAKADSVIADKTDSTPPCVIGLHH